VGCFGSRQLAGWASLLDEDILDVIAYDTDAVRFCSLPILLTHALIDALQRLLNACNFLQP
jgi:hypothetical protein